MKWETLQNETEGYAGKISVAELATVEALRAIAEQIERVAARLEPFEELGELIARARRDYEAEQSPGARAPRGRV